MFDYQHVTTLLLPLILMTAYGKDHNNIRDFIYVGFDDYLAKRIDGETFDERDERILDTIKIAQENAKKRIKSCFSSNELTLIETKLNMIEQAIQYLIQNTERAKDSLVNMQTIAAAVGYLKKGEPIDKAVIKEIRMANMKSTETLIKKYKLIHYNTLSNDFQIRVAKAIDVPYTENALKTRFLLKSHPQKWQLTTQYFEPVINIKKHFCL